MEVKGNKKSATVAKKAPAKKAAPPAPAPAPAPAKKAPAKKPAKAPKKPDPMKELACKLKSIRLGRGLTTKELAEKAGVSPTTVRAYEKGTAAPKLATLLKIIDALGYKYVMVMK